MQDLRGINIDDEVTVMYECKVMKLSSLSIPLRTWIEGLEVFSNNILFF